MTLDERNRAIFLVQRFVRMSRQLLPAFAELITKKKLNTDDESSVRHIEDVYDQFSADPDITRNLINSNIVALIQQSYQWLKSHRGHSPFECDDYCEFLEESDRLMYEWEVAGLN